MKSGIDLFSASTKVDLAVFGNEFGTFRHSAKRLELLPRYSVPSEEPDVARFLAGQSPRPELNAEWLEILDAAANRAATVSRLRVLGSPLTSYERFETEHAYPLSRAHGEVIRFLDRQAVEQRFDLNQSLIDYWVFDDTRAYLMHYDARGGFLGVTKASDADASDLLRAFEALWIEGKA